MAHAKLFYIQGIRHSAVVIAGNVKEAIKLATKAHGSDYDKRDPRVLVGSVGDWEIFDQ